MSDALKKTQKKGIDYDESRGRRTETTIQVRKGKKNETLSKIRTAYPLGQSENNIPPITNPNCLPSCKQFLIATPNGKNRMFTASMVGQTGEPFYGELQHFAAGFPTQQNVYEKDGVIFIIKFIEPHWPFYSIISFYCNDNQNELFNKLINFFQSKQKPLLDSIYKFPNNYEAIREQIANEVLDSAECGIACSITGQSIDVKKARTDQNKFIAIAKTMIYRYSAFVYAEQGSDPVRTLDNLLKLDRNGSLINLEKELYIVEEVTAGGTKRRKSKKSKTKTKRRKTRRNKSKRRR